MDFFLAYFLQLYMGSCYVSKTIYYQLMWKKTKKQSPSYRSHLLGVRGRNWVHVLVISRSEVCYGNKYFVIMSMPKPQRRLRKYLKSCVVRRVIFDSFVSAQGALKACVYLRARIGRVVSVYWCRASEISDSWVVRRFILGILGRVEGALTVCVYMRATKARTVRKLARS